MGQGGGGGGYPDGGGGYPDDSKDGGIVMRGVAAPGPSGGDDYDSSDSSADTQVVVGEYTTNQLISAFCKKTKRWRAAQVVQLKKVKQKIKYLVRWQSSPGNGKVKWLTSDRLRQYGEEDNDDSDSSSDGGDYGEEVDETPTALANTQFFGSDLLGGGVSPRAKKRDSIVVGKITMEVDSDSDDSSGDGDGQAHNPGDRRMFLNYVGSPRGSSQLPTSGDTATASFWVGGGGLG